MMRRRSAGKSVIGQKERESVMGMQGALRNLTKFDGLYDVRKVTQARKRWRDERMMHECASLIAGSKYGC